MPTKPNYAGNQQNYVPAGNGQASGEYADNATGSNIHFVNFAKPLPQSFTKKVQNSPKTVKKVLNDVGNIVQQPTQVAQSLANNPIYDESKVAQGNDILADYKRDIKNYQYGIENVLAKQGFDGLPQILDKQEFEKAVKLSGFIAQRTYRASSQAIADKYQDELYHGKWYVDCSNGGAQYGQGMYCAADYTGTLTKGIKDEMEDYKMGSKYAKVETFTLTPDAKIIKHREIISTLVDKMKADKKVFDAMHDRIINNTLTNVQKALYQSDQTFHEFIDHELEYQITGDVKHNKKLKKAETDAIYNDPKYKKEAYGIKNRYKDFREEATNAVNSSSNYGGNLSVSRICDEYLGLNDGELAALMGYDAINAEGHGRSGSYTVILNRTKCLFLKGA